MTCRHLDSLSLNPPTPAQSVYREDCTQCFDSIDEPEGLDVCLQCFNGGCVGDRTHSQLHYVTRNHPLALNIRRTRKRVVKDEPPAKMTKLAITAETEADRYDISTVVKCHECLIELDKSHAKLAPIVDGILKANTFSRQEEVKAWEQELSTCEHILMLQQEASRKIESGDLGHCSKCDLKENLWLCLACGNLGCGRAQFGGVGGNSHGLAHATESHHPVAVKLGSITPEGSADVYCYQCDDERLDDELAPHLAHWGIILADQVKTEKSLTEMQIEQNLRWEFSMTTEDGKELQPLFGPSLTGLKNLGNSCYLASILQCLFDLPSFQERYNIPGADLPRVPDPAQDLETQMRKIADGLLSGRYSNPDSDVIASERLPEVPHQKGLAPSMLKHLIGRGHPEFSTMRQQDSFEFLQHLIKLITRAQHPAPLVDPTQPFRFVLEQRLQCINCKKVRYSSTEQDSIFIDVPLEKLPSSEGEEGDRYQAVALEQCLNRFTAQEAVELTCPACDSKVGFMKRVLFKTFPTTLVINARKMTIENWVPRKVDVPVIVPDGAFSLDGYISPGHQESEELLPEEENAAAPTFAPNEGALDQLMAMGFPRNRSEKALYATGNSDANSAMEWLFSHMEDPDIDDPLVLTSTGSGGGDGADPEKIEMLGAMGFNAPQARKALKETNGDVERAVEWLFSHPDDQGDTTGDNGAATEKQEQLPAGSADLPANFQLRSIVCHKGTSIHAGHYVAFVRKQLDPSDKPKWVLFNDEKVVEAGDVEEMKKTAYVYFFNRVRES
ncbi:ubiquitin carboxyl-terminal hydrolase 14 [Xylaria bambusicola]|uniref:ubiquitin carboxyl-terminal hydrolase 14 n=1 Tax=Xylaria bambusicola TaxID=326684 RepID=UPI002008593F|nr:ubiquitin carboxyl-terminal hydrolase 14 [Xylaria bambusicola]KAI0506028.1 ubiquitin carboxyl-terminal hydrolase 14 [Xylaria bambusicola]